MNNYISYCNHCGTDVVICGKCGNNCCNGGYGEIFTEVSGVMKVCDQCPSAYLMQEEHYKTISKQLSRNPTTPSPEDILLWPDYFFCYRYELEEYSWKSDDYEVFYFGTPEYDNFTNETC